MSIGRAGDSAEKFCAVIRDITPGRRPRKSSSTPRQAREDLAAEIRLPRQGQPRDPHAAQRHHRLLRSDDGGALRPGRERALPAISAATSTPRAGISSRCSTTCSISPRSRAGKLELTFTGVVSTISPSNASPSCSRRRTASASSSAPRWRRSCRRSSPTRARCARSCSTCCPTRSSSPAPAGR